MEHHRPEMEPITEPSGSLGDPIKLNALAEPFELSKQQPVTNITKIPSTSFAFNLPESELLPSGLKTYEFNDRDREHLRDYFKPTTPPATVDKVPFTPEEVLDYSRFSAPPPAIQKPEFTPKEVANYFKTSSSIGLGGGSNSSNNDSSAATHEVRGILENYGVQTPVIPQVQYEEDNEEDNEEPEYSLYIPSMDNKLPPAVTKPEMMSFLNLVDDRWPDMVNYFIIEVGWKRDEIFPGIPRYYAPYVEQGVALYVYDAPQNWTPKCLRELFKLYKIKVTMDPCMVDIKSGEAFRWVVVETLEQADKAIKVLSGVGIPWKDNQNNPTHHRMYLCKALLTSYEIGGFWSLARFLLGYGPQDPPATQAPPKQVVRRLSSLAPIPLTPVRKNERTPTKPRPNEIVEELVEIAPIRATVDKGKGNAVDEPTEEVEKVVSAQEATKTPATSWAMMAIKAGGESKTINLHPENKTTRLLPTIARTRLVIKNTPAGEKIAEQMRLVFLIDLPSNITLQKVSNGIKEGPLVSIRMGINEDDGKKYAGIIFQYAEHAEAFFQVLCKERRDSNPQRFHFIVDVARGDQPIPTDETIKAMGAPTWATRRLTLVKSKFFFVMRQSHLQAFCEKEVGAENIQLAWLYNGGNATVAFAKVEDAIKVKRAFEREAASAEPNSHFSGLHVSFSKDPCVQEIHLVSDFP